MLTNLKLGAIVIFSIVLIDYIWLNLVAKSFYIEQLSVIGRIEDGGFKPVFWPIIVVYLLLATGLIFFVLPKIAATDTLAWTFLCGAVMGLVIYGVYDMTNHATLKDYPLPLTFVDMLWGTFLNGVVACIAKYFRDVVL